MSFEDNQEKGFTRRTFIKGAALGTVGIASAGLLAGCGGSEETPLLKQHPAGQRISPVS